MFPIKIENFENILRASTVKFLDENDSRKIWFSNENINRTKLLILKFNTLHNNAMTNEWCFDNISLSLPVKKIQKTLNHVIFVTVQLVYICSLGNSILHRFF